MTEGINIDELAEKVAVKVTAELRGACLGACGLSPEARCEMPHIVGVIRDAGNDSYARGAEHLRAMLTFFRKMDTAATWIVRAVLVLMALAFARVVWGWVGTGIFTWLKSKL